MTPLLRRAFTFAVINFLEVPGLLFLMNLVWLAPLHFIPLVLIKTRAVPPLWPGSGENAMFYMVAVAFLFLFSPFTLSFQRIAIENSLEQRVSFKRWLRSTLEVAPRSLLFLVISALVILLAWNGAHAWHYLLGAQAMPLVYGIVAVIVLLFIGFLTVSIQLSVSVAARWNAPLREQIGHALSTTLTTLPIAIISLMLFTIAVLASVQFIFPAVFIFPALWCAYLAEVHMVLEENAERIPLRTPRRKLKMARPWER